MMKRVKPYWRMTEDEKFNWAYDEYLIRAHQYDMLKLGKLTNKYVNDSTKKRREVVGLSLSESFKVIKDIISAINISKEFISKKGKV